jgi:hypothetical protein
MINLIFEMFQPVNLVPTMLLLVVLAYWLLAIIGVLGGDLFDIDLDGSDAGDGWAAGFKFLHLGDVPIMLVVSLFVLFFWATTIMSNHYFNPNLSGWVVVYFLIPNLIASLLVTKLILFPTVTIFKKLSPAQSHDKAHFVGRLAVVQTSEITDEFGQISIQQDGPPLVFNARSYGHRPIKGEVVEITEYEPVKDLFVVRIPKPVG